MFLKLRMIVLSFPYNMPVSIAFTNLFVAIKLFSGMKQKNNRIFSAEFPVSTGALPISSASVADGTEPAEQFPGNGLIIVR